ncbi:hypothetical protein K440DRAFT_264197 [Wilcoxina mikolae CBS 423.85]|nr:hypothetical protein K440DRAFT_264197 [Wilcoxina mikolae CBS 423.85]
MCGSSGLVRNDNGPLSTRYREPLLSMAISWLACVTPALLGVVVLDLVSLNRRWCSQLKHSVLFDVLRLGRMLLIPRARAGRRAWRTMLTQGRDMPCFGHSAQ